MLALLVACGGGQMPESELESEPDMAAAAALKPASSRQRMPADHVGAAVCAECHAEQHRDWQGSHHALAMQPAGPDSVLGDFDQASFNYAGVRSEFFRRGDRYLVITDGPDGQLAEFELAYTFGVEPLQQYLIELPGGRLQALGIAWDSRPEQAGGQRWFHLYPDQAIDHRHPLHWTGRNQNWNFMCADCHSTALVKGYDPASDSYDSHWSEIHVACEACHGPGQAHVAWARSTESGAAGTGLQVEFHERRGISWLPDADLHLETGTARRSQPRASRIEIDSCGRCHGRASRLLGDSVHGGSLLDSHRPVLLEPGEFQPDGQMLAEVFNWASFLQSRMAEAGVTCSDCHQPHSLALRAPGNTLCTQCHQPARFDQPVHTGHALGSTGSQCSACHMPQLSFMQIDVRHDHAFRIPRPDLSLALGVPNACNDCHQDRSAEWARDILSEWFPDGPDRSRDFAPALHGAELGAPGFAAQLWQLVANPAQPAVVRASALRALAAGQGPDAGAWPIEALHDPDPLLRLTAVELMAQAPPELRRRHLPALLKDPVTAVRLEAATALAGAGEEQLSAAQAEDFRAALAELLAALDFNAERPEAQVRLGNLQARRGQTAEALAAYRRALALDPATVEAWINLADLERGRVGERGVEAILRQGLEALPEAADLHHALGLSLVRKQRLAEALPALERAAELAPAEPRHAFVLAVALHQSGQTDQARAWLEQNLKRHPYHRDSLSTLAIQSAHTGKRPEVRALSERLAELEPDSDIVRQLRQWLSEGQR